MPAKVPRIEQHCLYCGKSTYRTAYQVSKGLGKFCSYSCRSKYHPPAKIPIGTEWAKRIEIPCECCGKIMRLAPCKTYKMRDGKRELRRFCSKQCADQSKPKKPKSERKLTILTCWQCGKQYEIPTCWTKKRFNTRFCSRHCQGVYYASPDRVGYVSLLETAVCQALDKRNIKYETQYKVGQYFIDIAFPQQKIAIECDGEYWHGLAKQQVKDRRKDDYLLDKGWKVLRLLEKDITSDVQACVDQIQRLL